MKKSLISNFTITLFLGSYNFNQISSSESNSNTFCTSVLNALVQYKLDGLDIDWEYPSNKAQYTTLIKANTELIFVVKIRASFMI